MRIAIAVHGFPPTYVAGAELETYRRARWLQKQGDAVQISCIESIDWGDGNGIDCVEDVHDQIPVRRLKFNLQRAADPFRWGYNNPLVERDIYRWLQHFEPDLVHLVSGYLMSGSVITAAKRLQIPIVITLTDYWFLCHRITLLRSDGSLCQSYTDLDCAICLYDEQGRFRIPHQIFPRLAMKAWRWASEHPIVGHRIGLLRRLDAIQRRRAFLRSCLSSVEAIICPSQFLMSLFVRQGLDPARLIHCRQGLDLGVARPLTHRFKERSTDLSFGYIGQIAKHKGVHLLIRAFQELRPSHRRVKLLVYGSHRQFVDYGARLRRLAKGSTDLVFAGPFANCDVGYVLAGIDVLVVPSLWYENSPNVILEAHANMTPVIASDLGGMAELVTHEVNGLLFRAGDVDGLARQLQRLVEEPGLLERLRQGIKPVKTLDEEMEELTQIYRSLLPSPVAQEVPSPW